MLAGLSVCETSWVRCPCCGGTRFLLHEIIWDELAADWELSPHERAEVNREQGLICAGCNSKLRSMALASAVLRVTGYDGLFKNFVTSDIASRLRVLEINEAGDLTKYLQRLPHWTLVSHPEVDMRALPFDDHSFDLVLHSDTLEHVPDPTAGLHECARVLVQGGVCCFTVPVVTGRISRSRAGLLPSYHGSEAGHEYLVHTEFGADVWRYVLEAGFASCTFEGMEGTTGLAVIARSPGQLELRFSAGRSFWPTIRRLRSAVRNSFVLGPNRIRARGRSPSPTPRPRH